MNLSTAVSSYKNKARNLLLAHGELDTQKIELIYKLDQACVVAESLMAAHELPFKREITSLSIDDVMDEADELEDRVRHAWLDRMSSISMLFNYANLGA